MNSSMVATLLVTLAAGGAIGGGVIHFTSTATLTCAAPPVRFDEGMSRLLQPTPIPQSGYKTY